MQYFQEPGAADVSSEIVQGGSLGGCGIEQGWLLSMWCSLHPGFGFTVVLGSRRHLLCMRRYGQLKSPWWLECWINSLQKDHAKVGDSTVACPAPV